VAGRGNQWKALYAGDRTLVLEFDQRIDSTVVAQVNSLDTLIQASVRAGKLDGVIETVPTFRSLAVIYDSSQLHPDKLLQDIRSLESDAENLEKPSEYARHWQLPVLYGHEQGPDLDSVAALTGLSSDEVIELHCGCTFTTYMLGFLPGYAFLGDTPAPLHLPRRAEPRLRVPAGSVAIAMQLTGIYPWESPGGWHILGNCPVPMFNASLSPPALLKAGDRISFTSISAEQFKELKHEIAADEPDRSRWAVDPS